MSEPNHRPDRPLELYPEAEMPALPPEGAPGEAPAPAAPAPVAPPASRPEAAVLDFLDPAAIRTDIPLDYPFRHEGREVRSITVRRLTTAEVGAVIEAIPEGANYDLYDFVAAMSGLPAPVLRGLIDDDGAEVLAKARPFLPRAVAAIFYSPTSGSGGRSPSPPPAA
ncbi:phage tail assembly protein [Methylobacterium sp. SyP6R]|uniref:phage tail assembly protein n=1 Tax=Methylobacterium sp. SyP6R TaxID=2718876 RepID=UPI001F4126BB|nr:phage tail assembly protein [Methylobacterium sp. SyP6R]MCF4125053.1 phage tail assembly protein [Methylobacterium sp. SyP6R]